MNKCVGCQNIIVNSKEFNQALLECGAKTEFPLCEQCVYEAAKQSVENIMVYGQPFGLKLSEDTKEEKESE